RQALSARSCGASFAVQRERLPVYNLAPIGYTREKWISVVEQLGWVVWEERYEQNRHSRIVVGDGTGHRGRGGQPADDSAGRSSASGDPRFVWRRAGRRRGGRHFGPLRRASGMAERSDHAPGPREMDIWRRPRHLRREPEPRVSARRRRVAG